MECLCRSRLSHISGGYGPDTLVPMDRQFNVTTGLAISGGQTFGALSIGPGINAEVQGASATLIVDDVQIGAGGTRPRSALSRQARFCSILRTAYEHQ